MRPATDFRSRVSALASAQSVGLSGTLVIISLVSTDQRFHPAASSACRVSPAISSSADCLAACVLVKVLLSVSGSVGFLQFQPAVDLLVVFPGFPGYDDENPGHLSLGVGFREVRIRSG